MTDKKKFLIDFQEKLNSKITGTQKWWTKALFHFTDTTNAVSILNCGVIYSRNKAVELGLMNNDNANDDVIKHTTSEYKNYTRLYFGPSTPTQYNTEGIKPQSYIVNNAHCPVPVMFVFDFIKIFMIDGVKFTDGNLATNPNIYNNIKDLNKLNFNLIYHRSRFEPEDRNKIINARHSEVLIKNKLELTNNLKLLMVRSEAEKETLLYQLPQNVRMRYQNKIYIQPQSGIFINDWLYIEKVYLTENQIHIKWHLCSNGSKCQDSYSLLIIASDIDKTSIKKLTKLDWYPKNSIQKINLPKEFINKQLELTIIINDIAAYKNLIGDNFDK